MSNRIRQAANAVARGNSNAAIALLTTILAQVDGQSNDDWMVASPERDVLTNSLVSLIQILGP